MDFFGDRFGGIGDLLTGDVGGGLQRTGLTGTETDQRIILDPTTRQLNLLRAEELNSLKSFYNQSGLSNILGQLATEEDVYPGTLELLGRGVSSSLEPGLGLDDYYSSALQSLSPDFYLNNARDYYTRIARPEISNQYSLLGLGRSGAVEEANAKAIAGLSLPISQQYLNNRFALESSRPGVDIALRNARLQRLAQGAEFSDYPRQQRISNLERQLQGYSAFATSTPYTPEPRTTGRGNEGILTSYLQGGGGGTAAGGIAALRGASDARLKIIRGNFDSRDLLDSLTAYYFSYKATPNQTQVGILADDLEKTSAKDVVVYQDGYRYLDTNKAVSLLLGIVTDLNTRINTLEKQLSLQEV